MYIKKYTQSTDDWAIYMTIKISVLYGKPINEPAKFPFQSEAYSNTQHDQKLKQKPQVCQWHTSADAF